MCQQFVSVSLTFLLIPSVTDCLAPFSTPIYRSTKLATLLGCPQSSPSDMKACLQQADPMELTLKQYDVIVWPSLIGIPFGPYVDGHFLQDTVEVCVCACVCYYGKCTRNRSSG